ncbi:hypothetical protein DFO73_10692 [Cytobacillus oceanisediminis]|jgi:hypothetical protein|uniref:Uncharacterized protein n=1 Tax=Cytobacillus oceanisediminis TaxID=665099 RepID=A0A2V2ZWF5_9BACI|nr:hypothetical protein DFO73_10692 [Cytobacillus oceanisediminis]
MGNTCRYVVSATGKNGEMYYTHCKDKAELRKWLSEHQEQVNMKDVKIKDKNRHPLLRWLNF